MACIAIVTVSGTGIAGYTVVKEDIQENSTKIERDAQQDKERYDNIQKQLGTILDHLLEKKNDGD